MRYIPVENVRRKCYISQLRSTTTNLDVLGYGKSQLIIDVSSFATIHPYKPCDVSFALTSLQALAVGTSFPGFSSLQCFNFGTTMRIWLNQCFTNSPYKHKKNPRNKIFVVQFLSLSQAIVLRALTVAAVVSSSKGSVIGYTHSDPHEMKVYKETCALRKKSWAKFISSYKQ